MTKAKELSTFDQEMQDSSFKKEFDKAYEEFALSELLLSLMAEDHISVRKLAKAAGLFVQAKKGPVLLNYGATRPSKIVPSKDVSSVCA